MSMVVTITMAVMATAIMDFIIPSCSTLTDGNEGSVKIQCSCVMWGWAVASVLHT